MTHTWGGRCAGFLLLILFSSISMPQQTAEPAIPQRTSSIPVREVWLSDGTARFTIPVRIGSKTIEAGLDTGSVGLRVMARDLGPSDAQPGSTPENYAYGSGVRLIGVQAQAQVSIGQTSGPLAIQLVNGIACLPKKPNCPASRISYERYGIMGDGIAGQGFEAIVGIKTNNDARIPNPLRSLGATRWTLSLPGGRLDGKLVLNPDAQSLSGFVRLPVATGPDTRLHDAVRGCIRNGATQHEVCGSIEMDTGAPGIQVTSPQPLPEEWRASLPASLLFQDGGGQTRATEDFRVNDRMQMSRVRFEQRPDEQGTVIHAGGSPLLCFEVLFDSEAGTLGFKARSTGPQLPHCSVQ